MDKEKVTSGILDTIRKIREARCRFEIASKNLKMACSPTLHDTSLIPVIYRWFCEIVGDNINVEKRRQFLFIVLYLYSPKCLLGAKMPNGLRRAIVHTTKVSKGTVISDNANGILVRYNVYKWWKSETDEILCRIVENLENSGHIQSDQKATEK